MRAVLLDPDDRVLLVQFREPETGAVFWTTPGGGIDPGETLDAALRRELHEETGLAEFEPGPVLWTRREVFRWAGQTYDQRETFVLVRLPAFEVRPTVDLADEHVHDYRWWTVGDLEGSAETIYPTRLAALLRELAEQGPPAEPFDAGV
ncbi:MAG TPA: NUDIX domain-containing protein [Gaiellaceae bacterium]|nr:NUDIX domain-containing protein [Gaiellaceae bacterium]